MSPGINIVNKEQDRQEYRQGYAEGFAAGRACIHKELKELQKIVERAKPFESTSTYTITGDFPYGL